QAHVKGQLYAEYYSSPAVNPWYSQKSLKREEIVMINRIRSNHYNLQYSLYRKNIQQQFFS
ncbi:hypothetical protein ALC56_13101, partial [Trachymyrmex septentrionalis]